MNMKENDPFALAAFSGLSPCMSFQNPKISGGRLGPSRFGIFEKDERHRSWEYVINFTSTSSSSSKKFPVRI